MHPWSFLLPFLIVYTIQVTINIYVHHICTFSIVQCGTGSETGTKTIGAVKVSTHYVYDIIFNRPGVAGAVL